MLGVVTARVISKGRHGRTTEIQISNTSKDLTEVLNEDEVFKDLATYKMKEQARLTI
jgi:Cdc6-like AAA superfamily ATPase